MICTTRYTSPLGEVLLASDGSAITGTWFLGQKYFPDKLAENPQDLPVFAEARRWLDIYFSGKEPDFLLPLAPSGTMFQQQVWEILSAIPYGRTITYGDIARQLAAAKGLAHMSAQAVGGAVGHNPISIFIPCHRVVGRDGSLTGYAGGLERKTALLKLEGILEL